MPSVAIVLRKDKVNKKGEAPIHFRIIKNRKSTYIGSSIMIPKDQWDEKRNKVKSSHRNSSRLNSYLSNKFTEIQDKVFEHETVSQSLSSRNLRDRVFGKKPTSFFAFAENIVAQYKNEGRIGSYDKNKSVLSKLRDYLPTSPLTFHDITPDFLVKYEKFLREEHGNKINTINKDMKFIRKVFNDAIRQDVIGYEATPFRKYRLRVEKTQRFYLTEEELSWLERYPATPGSRIELHRDMFVFSAYTGGLRISDMLQLQWKDFNGTHLDIVIKKTGVQVSIKVPNKGLGIIKKYKPTVEHKEAFIFPMLPEIAKLNSPEKLDAAISSATAYVNKNLKVIALAVGIEKNLSFHISRHTFAVRALRMGISIDKVSKLMAHAAIRETQIYAKVVNEELYKAMDAFNI
jgi:integrase/recombinase XerD